MDPDVIITLLFVVIWLFSSVAGQLKKLFQNRPKIEERSVRDYGSESAPSSWSEPPPPPPPPPPTPQESLREMFRQMGMEVELRPAEPPVVSEHTYTRGEHSQSPWEVQGTVGEHSRTASEHRHVASDITYTSSEHVPTSSEHWGTASEHVRGDVRGPIDHSAASFASETRHRRKPNRVARDVKRDLKRRGGGGLARAFAFREILGPPRSLEAYGQGNRRR